MRMELGCDNIWVVLIDDISLIEISSDTKAVSENVERNEKPIVEMKLDLETEAGKLKNYWRHAWLNDELDEYIEKYDE